MRDTALFLYVAAVSYAAKSPFYVGHVYAIPYSSNKTDAVAAVQLAIDTINNGSVLNNYNANLTSTLNAQCQQSPKSQLDAFYAFATASPAKMTAVIGGGCPAVTESTAALSSYLNLLQISYDTGAISLSNINFIRTYPSDEHLIDIVSSVAQYYGWKKIHLITQDETLFTDVSLLLKQAINSSEAIVQSKDTQISEIFPVETRIFVLNMYPLIARRVLCYAVQQNAAGVDPSHYYVQYVWITLGWYPQQWWTRAVTPDSQYTDTFTVCSDAALEAMLHWALAINHRPQPLDTTGKTDVNYTSAQFQKLIAGSGTSEYFFQTSVAPFAYDAVFALAFAVKSVDKMNIIPNASNFTTYLRNEMLKLNFTGISGPVTFDGNGTRIQTSLQVFKYRSYAGSVVCGTALSNGYFERVAIGTVTNGTFKYITCESNQTVWGSLIPPDGSRTIGFIVVAFPLFIVYAILTSLGILFAIICALFNLINRNHKIVRLTSPDLNYVIVLGVSLMLFSIYLYCISSSDFTLQTIVGKIRLWTQAVGFSLCFGTILAKVWRVYYIFHNPSAVKKTPPKDWQLFLFVMALIVIDIVFLTIAQLVDDYTAKKSLDLEMPSNSRNENNVLATFYYVEIRGDHEKIWKTLLYAFKGLVQATAFGLAVATRKVHIKVLNDAKYIAAIIYTTTILLLISVLGLFVLSGKYMNAFAGVFSMCLMIVCYVVLTFLFIPKMWIFYKDPKGERIFERSNSVSGSSITADQTDGIKLKKMEKRVKELEASLSAHEKNRIKSQPSATLSLATPPASPTKDGAVFEDEIKKPQDDDELPSSPTKKVSFAGQE
ncbi:hypothetical protein EMCRGX_G034319 [Ephydatia muelleri]